MTMREVPRVVITGMGAISPLGLDVPGLWPGIKQARSGVGPITRFDPEAVETKFAAEVKGFDPGTVLDKKEARRSDRVIQLALAAADEALRASELRITPENGERIGVVIGSGIGGIETLGEGFAALHTRGPGRVSPFLVPMMIADMSAGMVSIRTG